ncbi:MAG TPA: hypothetical protein VE398_07795 [Acidobacteriota bacterium]|nr:hypothetical protein [Acidobacteriota bacterium]
MQAIGNIILLTCLTCPAATPAHAPAQTQSGHDPAASVPAENVDTLIITAKMTEHNTMRERTLHNYSCERTYRVENKRVNKSATVDATMIFIEPDEKLFRVRSYSGMGFMRKGVLNRLIETERENSRGSLKLKTALSAENYEFEYLRSEKANGRLQYLLRAKARRKDRLLFNGTIWVDAEDGAVTRIEGRPAKSPSFWTRKVDFVQEYQKQGPYWFPARNSSVTQVFIFGRTTTEIEYRGYQVNLPENFERAEEIRKSGSKLEVQIDSKDRESPSKPRS